MCDNTHKIIVEKLIYFRKTHVTLASTEAGGRFLSANMTLLSAGRSQHWAVGEIGPAGLCVLLEMVRSRAQSTNISPGLYTICLHWELYQLLLLGSIVSRLDFSLLKLNIFHLQICQILA